MGLKNILSANIKILQQLIMKNIVIFGSGDHAKVIFYEIIKIKKYNIIGFIDNKNVNRVIASYKKKNYKVLGKISEFKKKKINFCGIIGVGSNFIREKILIEVEKNIKDFFWEKIISKNSQISKNAIIGEGSFVASGSIICNGTKIGNHCIINTGSFIDHDNVFENFSSTGPRVTCGGNVKVGKYSHLGIASTINNNIQIGYNTVVGGASFVNKTCKNNSTYVGVPSKKKNSRKINKKYL